MAKATASGPRGLGGLGNTTWKDYVDAAQAHWVVRYLQPGESAWKEMWDSFILEDAAGRERYPEGRSILLHDLSVAQKAKILSSFPQKAEYARSCLWRLRFVPEDTGWVQ